MDKNDDVATACISEDGLFSILIGNMRWCSVTMKAPASSEHSGLKRLCEYMDCNAYTTLDKVPHCSCKYSKIS